MLCCAALLCCVAVLRCCAVLCCGCGVLYCRVLLLLWSDVSMIMMSVLTDRADDLHDHTQVIDEECLPNTHTAHQPTNTNGNRSLGHRRTD